MNGKPALQSVTIWGGLVALLSALLPILLPHLGLSSADAQEIVTDVGRAGEIVGSLVAIYGRYRASTVISSVK